MVYCTYNYSYWGLYKPTYNWGAPHCIKCVVLSMEIAASQAEAAEALALIAPTIGPSECASQVGVAPWSCCYVVDVSLWLSKVHIGRSKIIQRC